MTEIRLEGLRRTFGPVVAVDEVDLTVADGSFAVLLGPSGCGKTTTLNMVAGLEDVTAGRILFDGEEVQDVPPDERDVAMVFQSYALYPNRTVRQNIGFPLRTRKVPKPEIQRRVAAVAERLDLGALLDRHPRALSGGQQQRVALARAIVREPRAFLLDEPLSNLDAKLRADMRFELKALQRDLGGTFLHVTHDQAEAMSLADLLVVMRDGRIQQVGPPAEVYRRPANRFVATFVGIPAMNLVAGDVEDGRFRAEGWSAAAAGVRPGPVTLGVRSEDLTLRSGAAGRVRLVELVGADVLVEVECSFGRMVARAPADSRFAAGESVDLGVATSRLHFFDSDTGERLPMAETPRRAA
jgi:ABC-type sugar transport system ATPase subunit